MRATDLPADLQRAREPRGDGRRARAACCATGDRVLVIDDASPDGTGELADRLAAEPPFLDVLHRGRKEGLGPGLHRRVPARARRRRRARARDGLRLLARPGRRAAPDRRGRGRRRPRARLALRPGRRDPELGARAPGRLARREHLRADRAREPAPRPHGRLQVLPRASCSRRSTSTRSTRAATPSRSRRPTACAAPASAIVEVPISFSDRELGHSKMSKAIVAEAVWQVPLLRLRALAGPSVA